MATDKNKIIASWVGRNWHIIVSFVSLFYFLDTRFDKIEMNQMATQKDKEAVEIRFVNIETDHNDAKRRLHELEKEFFTIVATIPHKKREEE